MLHSLPSADEPPRSAVPSWVKIFAGPVAGAVVAGLVAALVSHTQTWDANGSDLVQVKTQLGFVNQQLAGLIDQMRVLQSNTMSRPDLDRALAALGGRVDRIEQRIDAPPAGQPQNWRK